VGRCVLGGSGRANTARHGFRPPATARAVSTALATAGTYCARSCTSFSPGDPSPSARTAKCGCDGETVKDTTSCGMSDERMTAPDGSNDQCEIVDRFTTNECPVNAKHAGSGTKRLIWRAWMPVEETARKLNVLR